MKFSFSLSLIAALSLLVSCGRGNASSSDSSLVSLSSSSGEEVSLQYAKLLKLSRYGDITKAEVRNPWDTTKVLHSYWLVPDSLQIPRLPDNATLVRTPLKSSVVYSGVHASLANELGRLSSVKGMCDVSYVSDPVIQKEIKEGKIADCGINTSPNLERVVTLSPDAILLSPYEGTNSYGKISSLGVPLIECADYMEDSPLGRAEWIRFYGRLFGEEAKADSIFDAVSHNYNNLKNSVKDSPNHPSVLFDRIYGNAWYVPEKFSTTSRFISDAGGLNPFDYLAKSGSAPLSAEEVLMKAGDCDFWLIRHAGENITYKSLDADNPVYSKFKAYKNGNVFSCNTTLTGVFDDAAFHPDRLLSDLVSILHPEVLNNHIEKDSLKKYYYPLSK